MNSSIKEWRFFVSTCIGGTVLALICIFGAPEWRALELFGTAVLIGAAVSCAVLWKVGLGQFRTAIAAAAFVGILAAAMYFLVTVAVLVIRDSMHVLFSTRNSILMLKFSFYLTLCSSVGGLITSIGLSLPRSKKADH